MIIIKVRKLEVGPYPHVRILLLVLMCISRATVSAVSCLVVPAFICIDLLISRVLKINDDDDARIARRKLNKTQHTMPYVVTESNGSILKLV